MVNADPTYIPEDETTEEKNYREDLIAEELGLESNIRSVLAKGFFAVTALVLPYLRTS